MNAYMADEKFIVLDKEIINNIIDALENLEHNNNRCWFPVKILQSMLCIMSAYYAKCMTMLTNIINKLQIIKKKARLYEIRSNCFLPLGNFKECKGI